MNKPAIIITGGTGFIGERLVNYFFIKGWSVKALVRNIPKNRIKDVEYIKYSLEEQPKDEIFESVDYLVHCAYLRFEKNKDADAINISGTKKLIELCRKKNIKPLFISSFSAHRDAESHYGKSKLECESLFDLSKDVVLKPGFVIGKKGLASELIRTMRTASYFPLVGGGTQPIQTIHIDDLSLIIERIFERNFCGLFHVAETEAITMKTFYEEIAVQLIKKIRFVPLSLPFLFLICKVSERLGIRLRVSSESVLGLKHLIKFDTEEDLRKLGVSIRNYRESLESVLR